MKKTPSIYFTILLTIILVLPFALMVFFKSEPYPAIILPGGFGITDVRENIITYNEYEIIVYNKSQGKKIKPEELFERIPKAYHPSIIKNSFKFKDDKSNEIKDFYEKNMNTPIDSIQGFIIEIKKVRGSKSKISRSIKESYSIKF